MGLLLRRQAYLHAAASFTNAGTITLTSASGGGPTCSSGYPSRLKLESGATLTNTGTINAEPGLGGNRAIEGEIINNGTVHIAEGVSLQQASGTFTNGAGGSVAATGTGRLWLSDGGVFKEGAGTTSGSAPVVIEYAPGEYTGSGSSHIVARSDLDGLGSTLKGNLSAGQSLTIEGTCNNTWYDPY